MKLTIRGTTDERDSCDCCGKMGLKRTVIMEPDDGGEYLYFGTSCAAKMNGIELKEVRKEAKAADKKAQKEKEAQRNEYWKIEHKKWLAWLTEKTGYHTGHDHNINLSIEKIGGYQVARKMYKKEMA